MNEWNKQQWMQLHMLGYHCEIREEGWDDCEYRPAPHWIDGHPACGPCYARRLAASRLPEDSTPTLP